MDKSFLKLADATSPESGFHRGATLPLLPGWQRCLPGLHMGPPQPHRWEPGTYGYGGQMIVNLAMYPGLWLLHCVERWFPIWGGGGTWQLDWTHRDGAERGKIEKFIHNCLHFHPTTFKEIGMIGADLTQTWSRMSIVSIFIQKIFKETI